MIEYKYSESPFFVANRNYCNKVVEYLHQKGVEFSGHCNCYGYEINAELLFNGHNYHVKCYKFQTTQNGVIIPANAHESLGVTIVGVGFNNMQKLKYGRSKLNRFFMRNSYKKFVESPYYLTANFVLTDPLLHHFIDFFKLCKVTSFNLKNGKIKVKIFAALANPIFVIQEMDKLLTQ